MRELLARQGKNNNVIMGSYFRDDCEYLNFFECLGDYYSEIHTYPNFISFISLKKCETQIPLILYSNYSIKEDKELHHRKKYHKNLKKINCIYFLMKINHLKFDII